MAAAVQVNDDEISLTPKCFWRFRRHINRLRAARRALYDAVSMRMLRNASQNSLIPLLQKYRHDVRVSGASRIALAMRAWLARRCLERFKIVQEGILRERRIICIQTAVRRRLAKTCFTRSFERNQTRQSHVLAQSLARVLLINHCLSVVDWSSIQLRRVAATLLQRSLRFALSKRAKTRAREELLRGKAEASRVESEQTEDRSLNSAAAVVTRATRSHWARENFSRQVRNSRVLAGTRIFAACLRASERFSVFSLANVQASLHNHNRLKLAATKIQRAARRKRSVSILGGETRRSLFFFLLRRRLAAVKIQGFFKASGIILIVTVIDRCCAGRKRTVEPTSRRQPEAPLPLRGEICSPCVYESPVREGAPFASLLSRRRR
jgi:hypothetical protein